MSDEIKWNKKSKEQRDAAREEKEKQKQKDEKAEFQKKKFSKVYEAWRKNLTIAKRTPLEVKAMLESLLRSLDEIVTDPNLSQWKEYSSSLIKEKVFAILYLQPSDTKPGDSANPGSSGSPGPDPGTKPSEA